MVLITIDVPNLCGMSRIIRQCPRPGLREYIPVSANCKQKCATKIKPPAALWLKRPRADQNPVGDEEQDGEKHHGNYKPPEQPSPSPRWGRIIWNRKPVHAAILLHEVLAGTSSGW
jgi:hypothetical protein